MLADEHALLELLVLVQNVLELCRHVARWEKRSPSQAVLLRIKGIVLNYELLEGEIFYFYDVELSESLAFARM